MTVFPFPPDFPGLSVPFSVVGFDWDSGAPDGELLVLPRGCEALAFDGPVFAPDAAFDDDRLLRPADAAPEHGPVWMDAFCPRGTLRSPPDCRRRRVRQPPLAPSCANVNALYAPLPGRRWNTGFGRGARRPPCRASFLFLSGIRLPLRALAGR